MSRQLCVGRVTGARCPRRGASQEHYATSCKEPGLTAFWEPHKSLVQIAMDVRAMCRWACGRDNVPPLVTVASVADDHVDDGGVPRWSWR